MGQEACLFGHNASIDRIVTDADLLHAGALAHWLVNISKLSTCSSRWFSQGLLAIGSGEGASHDADILLASRFELLPVCFINSLIIDQLDWVGNWKAISFREVDHRLVGSIAGSLSVNICPSIIFRIIDTVPPLSQGFLDDSSGWDLALRSLHI